MAATATLAKVRNTESNKKSIHPPLWNRGVPDARLVIGVPGPRTPNYACKETFPASSAKPRQTSSCLFSHRAAEENFFLRFRCCCRGLLPIVDYREQSRQLVSSRMDGPSFLAGSENCSGKRPQFIFILILSSPFVL